MRITRRWVRINARTYRTRVEVEANTEAQALAIIETKGLVSPHKRHLADEVKVERLP